MAFCDSVTVSEPMYTWTPTIAPAGLDYYDHPAIPEWRNNLNYVRSSLNHHADSITMAEIEEIRKSRTF